ncbi:extensin family protein [Sphingomonas bacterium]|uniref:extensin family protein n=1 Tax=Sphingomonas bacterium TaxID=1895847 RepID=UPI0015774792|nr:extensin family protein [Sphingomonas bacterium]
MTTAAMLAIALAGCGRSPPATITPRSIAAPAERETQACFADLAAMGVRFSPMVDHDFGKGCSWVGAVQLVDIGVPVTNLTAIRCGEARAFAGWVRGAVAPAAFQMLGSELARVEGMGSYACRNVVGSAGNTNRRSGHAIANAIDIGGFVLKDGRRVTILHDWTSPDPAVQRFLAAIHASACKRFGTVLSPAYNAAHANHFHLEDDRAGLCR